MTVSCLKTYINEKICFLCSYKEDLGQMSVRCHFSSMRLQTAEKTNGPSIQCKQGLIHCTYSVIIKGLRGVSSHTQCKYQHPLCSSNSILVDKAADSMSTRYSVVLTGNKPMFANRERVQLQVHGKEQGKRTPQAASMQRMLAQEASDVAVHTALPTQLRRQRVYKHTCALMSKGKPHKYK